MRPPRLTLAQFFFAATAVAVLVMGVLLYGFLVSSRRSIMESSERRRGGAARRIEARVAASLSEASDVLGAIERDANHGVFRADESAPVETRLFSAVLNAAQVADVTLTHGQSLGFDADGERRLRPDGRWQVAVFRASATPNSPILSRIVTAEDHRFIARYRERAPNAPLLGAPLVQEGDATDPTLHPTFGPPASKAFSGTPLWSDLHYSELDRALPSAHRRVVVSVQKAIEDAEGQFVGVLKVELLHATVDEELSGVKVDEANADDVHRVFLCDKTGWLVSRVSPLDELQAHGDDKDLRYPQLGPQVVTYRTARDSLGPREFAWSLGSASVSYTHRC